MIGQVLLLLDNLEQLLPAAAAEVDPILSACPNLVVVLTSRERLQLPAEQVYDVPPMTDSDARALFRSRSAAASVELTESDDLSTLCRRLDNLPLALELAAARTVLFTPGQLLERLGERLDLLRAGRGVDDRQKTLRATIEWSHSLLDEEEQALFRRLSVFSGGCTFESAEAVAGVDPDILQSLLAKSLLRRRVDARRPRFWMLATIHEFATERLAAGAEADEYRDRHMTHYAMVAHECIDDTMHERDDLERLDAERENLRLALESALETNPELAVELAPRLFLSWVRRGDLREGRTRLAAALDHAQDATETARAPALRAAARLAYWQGDLDAADRYGREAVEQFRHVGDDRGAGLALSGLGFSAHFRGDQEKAERLFEESLTTLSAPDQQFPQLQPMTGLARVMSARGEHARAVAMHQEVVERLRQDTPGVRLALSLSDLGEAQELAGRPSDAERSFEESVSLSRAISHTGALANALVGLAGVRRVTAPTVALSYYHESLQLFREMEQPTRIATCLRGGAAILSARGEVSAATKLLGAASAAQTLSVIAVRPGELPDVEALEEHCRQALGPEAFAKAWDEGAALSARDAADWALGLWRPEGDR